MRYRVTVEELTPAEDGIGDDAKTVVEFAGPGEMLARFAPGAVAEVLGAERAAVTVVMPSDRPTSPLPANVESPLAEPLPRAEAEQGDGPAGESAAEPTKRKRRTKAEIAADKEAQALGFRDAAHRAEVEQQQAAPAGPTGEGPTGDGNADLAATVAVGEAAVAADVAQQQAAGSYMTPDGPVVAEAPAPVPAAAAVAPEAAPAGTPAPAGPAAAPWNPFAQQ